MDRETRVQNCMDRVAAWYPGVRRALPWRDRPTPYRIWISEIMLQQTRIEAVIPYYERFLRELPDTAALAGVEEDRLLKLWEGLGYYSRARNLKKAAVRIMAEYSGELPGSVEELKKLPGIGDYTAGAIASIAMGLPEPAVDGNVLRVLSRVLESDEDVMQSKTRSSMTALLRRHYPSGARAALVTEGWMELGETVCTPNGDAKCSFCPLAGLCLAAEHGTVDRYPVRKAPKARRTEERTVFLLHCGERWAIRKREEGGLLSGLWEFPGVPGRLTEQEAADAVRRMGARPLSCVPSGRARHVFTHIEWELTGYLLELAEEAPGLVWKSAREIREDFSVPTAFRAYLKMIR